MRKLITVLLIFIVNILIAQDLSLGWQSCYGSSDYAGDNYFYALEKMPNGNIIGSINVAGDNSAFTNYHGNNKTDSWVLILDWEGNILSDRCFGGSEDDVLFDIETGNDFIYFYGGTNSIDGDAQSPQIGGLNDLWVVKTDYDLNIIWERKYGNLGPIMPKAAKVSPSGGLVFVADFFEIGGGDVSNFYGSQDIWVCNINTDGNIVWETTLGNQYHDEVGDVLVKENGNIVVLGETSELGGMVSCNLHEGYMRDYWISELDINGELLWQECYGGSRHEQGFDIIEDENGYTILGVTASNDGDVSGNHAWNEPDIWLFHIDSIGNLEWQKCFGGTESDLGYHLFKTPENGYVIIGISNSDDGDVTHNHCWPSGLCHPDVWVVITDSDRNILWENTYGGLANGQMQRNSTVQLGEMDFLITSAMDHEYYEEYGDVSADFDCTPYPVEENVSAWIFRLFDPTIGAFTQKKDYKSLQVYPNPAKDHIYFELPQNQNKAEIKILDVYGRTIETLSVIAQQTQVLWDTSEIKTGVYFYKTLVDNEAYQGKIIIQ